VTFLNSLHHVPSMALGQALREACRLLRRGGVVYVQEPLAEGGYYELVRMVDDEAAVRAAAQRVLAEPQRAGLRAAGELEYDAPVRHRDFAAFRDRVLLADARRTAAFARRASELEERFRTEGDSGPNGWCFQAPTRVTLLRRALD
jgi:SAM-dependent methyltransferase